MNTNLLFRPRVWFLATSLIVIIQVGLTFILNDRYERALAIRARERMHYLTMQSCYYLLSKYYSGPDRFLPPSVFRDQNGVPLSSWRFRMPVILLEQTTAYGERQAFELPWNHEVNADFAHPDLHCFYPDPWHFIDVVRPGHRARVVAIVGSNTAFDDSRQQRLSELPPNLVLLIERRDCPTNWVEPGGDVTVDQIESWFVKGVQSQHLGKLSKGFFVCFADGDVQLIDFNIPFSVLREFLTIDRASKAKRTGIAPSFLPHWEKQ